MCSVEYALRETGRSMYRSGCLFPLFFVLRVIAHLILTVFIRFSLVIFSISIVLTPIFLVALLHFDNFLFLHFCLLFLAFVVILFLHFFNFVVLLRFAIVGVLLAGSICLLEQDISIRILAVACEAHALL